MTVNIPETLRALAKYHNDRAEPETTIALRYAAAEIEELRAAICDRFEIIQVTPKGAEAVVRCDDRSLPAVSVTILRILKQEKEQRNGN